MDKKQCKKSAQKFWSFMELSKQEVELFQWYIKQYHDHFEKGELRQAYDCTVAILTELQKMIPEGNDE